MSRNSLSWIDWAFIAFCWSLPFVCHAVRRWRIRVYRLTDPPSAADAEGWGTQAHNGSSSAGRPAKVDHVGGHTR